jgi:hypothetical protein
MSIFGRALLWSHTLGSCDSTPLRIRASTMKSSSFSPVTSLDLDNQSKDHRVPSPSREPLLGSHYQNNYASHSSLIISQPASGFRDLDLLRHDLLSRQEADGAQASTPMAQPDADKPSGADNGAGVGIRAAVHDSASSAYAYASRSLDRLAPPSSRQKAYDDAYAYALARPVLFVRLFLRSPSPICGLRLILTRHKPPPCVVLPRLSTRLLLPPRPRLPSLRPLHRRLRLWCRPPLRPLLDRRCIYAPRPRSARLLLHCAACLGVGRRQLPRRPLAIQSRPYQCVGGQGWERRAGQDRANGLNFERRRNDLVILACLR